MYEDIMRYLEDTKTSISTLMRHITVDYLRFKNVISKVEESNE